MFCFQNDWSDTLRSGRRFANGLSMLSKVKDYLRRRVRGVQRGGQYPLLLPHHALTERGVRTINGDEVAIDAGLKTALGLCNGQRKLSEVVREAGVSRAELIKAQDDGLVLFWRGAVPAQAPATEHHPHAIIVSPHLDDAALSCGGRMLGDQAVMVVNVFSRTAWWRFGHGAADAEKIQACREMEEELVARLSGAWIIGLGLAEALLRGYEMEQVFSPARKDGEVAGRDSMAAAKTREKVIDLSCEHSLAHWFLPLGVGGHVDHLLVRDAAVAGLREVGVKSTHLHFYEDLPYAAKLGPAADFSGLVPGFGLREEVLEIDELMEWKLELLRAYWSQFRWAELAELQVYARAAGGEVTWAAAAIR
jgi:LmbE family N-acetylglucosaminyl deacetylase